MPSSPTLSPELIRQSIALARALSAAVRQWALYASSHPAVDASVQRLSETLNTSTAGMAFNFGVTPTTLLVTGISLPEEQPVVEAARLLHDRDILQITFLGDVPRAALQALMRLLTTPSDEIRAAGGPAALWQASGDLSVAIEQIDYEKILEDRDIPPAERRDDLWRSLVRSMTDGQGVFDSQQQERLLAISGDAVQIGELATAVIAPKRSADGSPLVTTQAATVLAVFRHLTGIVQVMEPDRLSGVMRNVVAATASLDPHVVLQMMQSDALQEAPMVERIAAAFDDKRVAQLLATALARDGMATARLAQVFDTIAPDVERKRRVLTLARDLLSEHDFGKGGQFKAAWASMEGLLLNYDEKPYVSESYQTSLAAAGARADTLAARDLPDELPEWVETLGQENVRRLSVLLITDLLRMEEDAGRAADIARDVGALGEDLLMSGAFDDLMIVLQALKDAAERPKAVALAACRAAATALGESTAMHEAATLLGDLDSNLLATFSQCCRMMGPLTIRALRPLLEVEHETPAATRAREIALGFGAAGVPHIAKMGEDSRWFVQRAAATLLGATRSADAVPSLQLLLRRHDQRVLRAAVAALAGIDDPSAARAIQTALRAVAAESRRAVVEALVAEHDPRVVPMLIRILGEADPFGEDHQTVIDTLDAVRVLADNRAVPSVATTMRKKKFFARKKARAFKEAAVRALRGIGTPAAQQALDEAARARDRLLRGIIRQRS